MPEPAKYDATSRFIHWLSAFLIVGLYVVGLLFDAMARPAKIEAVALHMSFGLVLTGLILFRLFRHASLRRPHANDSGTTSLELAARAGHILLYLLMVLVPLTGILRRMLRGRPLDFFGLQIPSPIGDLGAAVRPLLKSHEFLAHALAAVVALHITAALWHHFIRRDNVLRSMLLGR